jgi:geranylgeranyl pyrophosphate synthase
MRKKSNEIDTFFENIERDINEKIKKTIPNKDIVKLLNNGNFIQSNLCALSFKTCIKGNESSSSYQRALEDSILIQIARTASLVNELIIKIEKERRGMLPYSLKEGIDNAILYGHKLLILGINIALSHGDEITKLVVDTWNNILNGEMIDINFNKKEFKTSPDKISDKSDYLNDYSNIINAKAASLFSFACKAGAIEAKQSGDILEVFANYGKEIGLAYQLADDLIILEKGEKSINFTSVYKVIFKKNPITLDTIRPKLITKNFKKLSPKVIQFFIDEIKKHMLKAMDLGKSEIIPQSKYKDILIEIPVYIINQRLSEINISI